MNKYNEFFAFAENLGCKCSKNEYMCKHTTFKIGGPADLYIVVDTEEKLVELVKKANEENTPIFVLGNGSNLLVSDNGIEGAVIKIENSDEIELLEDDVISCGAGVKLSALCQFALKNSLSGLEFAWGIPGSVGGAVFMNAGAYNGEIKNVITSCEAIDRLGNKNTYELNEMNLGYRNSVFKTNKEIITKAYFKLEKGNKDEIKSKMDDLMNRRKDKQPIEYPSAGSVFKRPVGNFAGTLIEQCGLKGKCIGDAEVSTKHAGFIINKNKATCEDVINLISLVKQVVFKKTNIDLEQEIAVTGR